MSEQPINQWNMTTEPSDMMKINTPMPITVAPSPSNQMEVIDDDSFSYDGYQVVRGEFFAHIYEPSFTFNNYKVSVNTACIKKLPDGINYVFNGQHTIEIVALVSGSRETPVWCMVYDDLVYTQEADIFANQMKYVKSLLPYEIFMANIEAGNDRELIIRDLVESYDLTITSSSRPGGICAVSTLINIYEKYGFHTLDRVLRLCVATWEGAPMSFSSNMLNAIARLDNAYGETMKDDTFKEKVGRVSVREISRTARERRAGSLGFAEALLLEYNKKSKYSLPFEKLYTHKTPKKREPSTEDESGQSSTPEGQLDLFSTDQENTQALPN